MSIVDFNIACADVSAEEASASARDLMAYWEARRLGRSMPSRRDLDVLDLAPWLGRLSLYEALGDGDFRCRIRGTTMSSIPVPGHASSGILVSRTKPREFAEMGLEHYRGALTQAKPVIHHIELVYGDHSYDYERISLPLAEGAGLPPMILTFITCNVARSRAFWHRFNSDSGAEVAASVAND
jgi:hypothetical protein